MLQPIARKSRIQHQHMNAFLLVALAFAMISAALFVGSNSAASATRKQSARALAGDAIDRLSKAETSVREQPLGAVDLRGSSEFSSVFSASSTAEPLAPVFLPTLQTFASDCTTPKSDFNVGDTVCVKSTSATVGDTLQWGDPCSDAAVRTTTVTSATMTDTFTLPASGQTTGGGACDARGDWKVDEFTSGNAFQAEVRFRVHDPAHAASNLSVVSSGGVTQPNADNAIIYFLTNTGPDDAANAQATFSVPTNMTFWSCTGAAGWT